MPEIPMALDYGMNCEGYMKLDNKLIEPQELRG